MVQQMQEQMQQLSAQLVEARGHPERYERMAQSMERVAAGAGRNRDGERDLVDTRGVGKPTSFGKGSERELEALFSTWARKLASFVVSVWPDMQGPLEWAARADGPLSDEDVNAKSGAEAEDPEERVGRLEEEQHQLYTLLAQVTEHESNDIVYNSGGRGLEAWRRLNRRWDPLTGGRVRNLLRQIANPKRTTLDQLRADLERWEELVAKYTNSKDSAGRQREMPDDLKMSALEACQQP